MAHTTKIATCSYCGARAALVLGRDRHELACDRCGAPLHDMKRLKSDEAIRSDRKEVLGHGKHKRPYAAPETNKYHSRKRPKKRRKSLVRYVLKEAIDVLEDIFD